MTDYATYRATIKQIVDRQLTVPALVKAAESLAASGAADLAMDLYKRWIASEPADRLLYVIHFNYALLLRNSGDLPGAQAALEHAVSLNPDFVGGHMVLGEVYEKLGQPQKAIAQWTTMVERPAVITGQSIATTINGFKWLGRALQAAQEHVKLEALLRRGLEIDPNDREMAEILVSLRLQHLQWPITSGAGVDRKVLLRKMGPFQLCLYTDDPMLHLASAWDYNKETVGYHLPCDYVRPREANQKRLRIGYLSADLTSHSTGYLMSEVFELHDRSKFEVFAYYNGTAAPDIHKTRIKAAIEHWVDISAMDDDTAARQIAGDQIDILVDLHGNTRGSRTRLMAMMPAPIIVNWIAYPGTMATPYHHYLIADDWIIPKSHEIYYSEKVVRLPCYQPNDRKRVIDARPTRAEYGLPEGAMVYCCFNGAIKITKVAVDRWMTILSRVPGSVLWLLDSGVTYRKRLVEYAVQYGIGPERLIFAPPMRRSKHLARYVLADLFLDTGPCGAHTTASDALWMGVPILTLSGHGFASRVCGSLARAAGLPEAVCSTAEEYVERAVALGTNRAEIQRQKKHLESTKNSCVLFDMESLVSHLEKLYRQMWKEFHAGQRPKPDLANLDVYFDLGLETDHDAVDVLAIKDYRGWYQERLASRHRRCPIAPDQRLWTKADIARLEVVPAPPPTNPAKPSESRARKPLAKPKKRRKK